MCNVEYQIKARIVLKEEDYQANLPILLFCTEQLMEVEIVKFVLNQKSNKLVLVHEGDGRRLGGLEGNEQEFWSRVFNDNNNQYQTNLSIGFDKSTRNVLYSRAFITRVLDSIGLIKPPFNDASQTKLVFKSDSNQVLNSDISDWLFQTNSLNKGLLLPNNDELSNLPIDSVRSFVDCSLIVKNDVDLIKSLSSQLFVNIPGFYQGFQQLKESNNTDLESCVKCI